MDESMYDEFGNYLGPDLSDEDEDDEEELQQQQQQQQQKDDQAMDEDEDEDVEMQEDNVRTSTALSRIGGKATNQSRSGRCVVKGESVSSVTKTGVVTTMDLLLSIQRSHRIRLCCTRTRNTTPRPRRSMVKVSRRLSRKRTLSR